MATKEAERKNAKRLAIAALSVSGDGMQALVDENAALAADLAKANDERDQANAKLRAQSEIEEMTKRESQRNARLDRIKKRLDAEVADLQSLLVTANRRIEELEADWREVIQAIPAARRDIITSSPNGEDLTNGQIQQSKKR